MTYAVSSTAVPTVGYPITSVSVSDDGRFVAYIDKASSAPSVVKVIDTQTGRIRSLGDEVDAARKMMPMTEVKMAGDGHTVTFTMADYEGTGVSFIAQFDLRTGVLRYVSSPADAVPNGGSHKASVSSDGRYVAFESDSSNLVANDTNGATDVFVKDMQTGSLRRVSTDAAGGQLSLNSSGATISADGKTVLFNMSTLSNPAITPAVPVAVKNLDTNALALIGDPTAGAAPARLLGLDVSADGRYVLMLKEGAFSRPGDAYTSFLYASELLRKDMVTGETVSVSAPAGTARYSPASGELSADGNTVLFSSLKLANGAPAGSTPVAELHARDMVSGAFTAVSFESGNGWGTSMSALSGDGAHVAYTGQTWTTSPAQIPTVPQGVSLATLRSDSAAAVSTTLARETYLAQQGNQVIDGGVGVDTAIYRGKAAEYTVKFSAGTVSVTDQQAGRDGVDLLSNIDRIRFSDSALAFDFYGNAGQAYRIYQAALNRAPDAAGLGYWIDRLDGGESLDAIAAKFLVSPEFTTLYGAAPTTAQFVDSLYRNVLHRGGDAAGVSYWSEILDQKKTTAADVLSSFSESAENVAALIGVADHGMAYLYQQPATFLAYS